MYYEQDEEDSGILPAPVQGTPADKKMIEKDNLMFKLQEVLNKGESREAESELIKLIQMNRRLMLDVATATFISKPNNPKLLDSINTLMAGLEKTVRDNRKEKAKDKELEDNKASFASFVNALNEVSAGRLVMPTYNTAAFVLDPLAPIMVLDKDTSIKDGEIHQGRMELNAKEIEATFDEDPDYDPEE